VLKEPFKGEQAGGRCLEAEVRRRAKTLSSADRK
jgi:hypothetical protein